MMRKMLGYTRYFILIAILGAFLAAILLTIYSGFLLTQTILEVFRHPSLTILTGRKLALECIELVDFFLLSTAFYIFAAGLYELFIDPRAIVPVSVRVSSLEDLKGKLIGVVIVVMSVFFLEQVINWNGESNIQALGISEALMIAVLTLMIKFQPYPKDEGKAGQRTSVQEDGSEIG